MPANNQTKPAQQSATSPWSLASRLLWPVALTVLLAGLLLILLLRYSIESHFAEMDAADLQSYAWQQLQHPPGSHQHPTPQDSGLIQAEPNQTGSAPAQASHQADQHNHHPRIAWLITSGQQADWPAALQRLQQQTSVSQISPAQLSDWRYQGVPYRGVRWLAPNGQELAVAMSLTVHQQYLSRLYLQLALCIAGAVLLVLLIGWYSIRRGLQPLSQLSQSIASIDTEQLHQRLNPQQLPAELQQLATSFNQMVSRLQQSFARLSEFSADIAHELRTPLSNLITQTEVSLGQARTAEQYRELLYSNLEELGRLARMVSDMLWLAKTDHGLIRLQRQPVQLQALCSGLLEYFQLLAEERQLRLALSGNDYTVQADKAMLQRALSNLLSNAVRHASQGSLIECQLLQKPEQPELCGIRLVNQGTTIAPELQQRLFERFFRAEPARQRDGQDGAGLGLALVQSIVQLHGGHVRVHSEAGITSFTLWLPCQPAATDNAERLG